MSEVRVRFAPSPTGFMHIGGVRTALFDYLLAKKLGGKFILRLEDTDRERYVEEAPEDIVKSLKWLGLSYDEGPDVGGAYSPYVQSERLDLYKDHAKELLEKGFAYKDEGAIRFKTTKEGKTTWRDLIGNKFITFENSTQEDFVILKSDGYPTYNFAHVIDDHYMKISHVIRGPEFISSTPKHIMVYQAFSWEIPQFAHVPMILGPDKSKLSKRHGARAVSDFKQDGYLAEAILNYMAFLGWTPPSGKEILSLEEMVSEFEIADVNVASPVFDMVKLDWINGEYIRRMSNEELTKRLNEYLVDHPGKEVLERIVPLVKERIKKLSDFIPLTDFIFEKPEYDKEVFNKLSGARAGALKITDKRVLEKVLEKMKAFGRPWKAQDFEETFRDLAKELEISVSDMFQLIRVAISGQLVTPPLFESIQVLGEEEAVKRVEGAIKFLSD